MRRPPDDIDQLADAIKSDDPNAFEDIVRLLGQSDPEAPWFAPPAPEPPRRRWRLPWFWK